MDRDNFYRDRLPQFLDRNGDLAPPWERFPNYERYTIGWRMGTGEDWITLWHLFLDNLDTAMETRLAYLKRHPPAPATWADAVHDVLYPLADELQDNDDGAMAGQRRDTLRQMGLIASEIAYSTWLSQQHGVRWPWDEAKSPEDAARYRTRVLWFWSRQVDGLRSESGWQTPEVPERWKSCDAPLRSGEVPAPHLQNGLLTLAQMLSAGHVTPPWQLGLTLADFADTFDDDMGFVDAFRLWGMCSFDDSEQFQQYLTRTGAPEVWETWCAEQFLFK